MNFPSVRLLTCLAISCFSAHSEIIPLDVYFGTGSAYHFGDVTLFATVHGLFLSTPIGPEVASDIAASAVDPIVTGQIQSSVTLSDFQFLAQPPQNLDAGQMLFDFISHVCAPNCQSPVNVFDTGSEFVGTVPYLLSPQIGPGGNTVTGSVEVSYFTRVYTVIIPKASAVPEPGNWMLAGCALLVCAGAGVRRRITEVRLARGAFYAARDRTMIPGGRYPNG